MITQRVVFYDNLKFVLISLVVLGHLLFDVCNSSFALTAFWRWIYLFHMPAFLFVGGMFAKRMYTPEKGLNLSNIVFYLLMAFLLYTGLWIEQHWWNPNPPYNLFNLDSVPWYFVAMATLGASTAVIANIYGGAKVVIPVAVLLGIILPISGVFGDFLVVGRSCVFAPFFFAGYYMNVRGYAQWVERMQKKTWLVIIAAGVLMAIFVVAFLGPSDVWFVLSQIATGRIPYPAFADLPLHWFIAGRVVAYLLAAVMIVAVSLLVPCTRTAFTQLGERTLQVYILHSFIYYPLRGLQLAQYLEPYLPAAGFILMVAGLALTVVLAWPKWPEHALRSIQLSLRSTMPALNSNANPQVRPQAPQVQVE